MTLDLGCYFLFSSPLVLYLAPWGFGCLCGIALNLEIHRFHDTVHSKNKLMGMRTAATSLIAILTLVGECMAEPTLAVRN